MALGRKTSRRQRPERSQHEGSQGASLGENQTSVFITRDEMETMMKRQEELIQNLFQQIGQLGAQNQGATGVQNRAGLSEAAPELGGTHLEHTDPIPRRASSVLEQYGIGRGTEAQPGGQIPEFPREHGGQAEGNGRGLQQIGRNGQKSYERWLGKQELGGCE